MSQDCLTFDTEFYGDVIPDGMDERAARDVFRDVKLTPAKRFGFFPSPDAVVDALFDGIHIEEGERVLEPSAGTGQIARVAASKGAKVDCIEIQRHLADGLEATGAYANVHCQDFHEFSPAEPYAKVIMNPPCLLDITQEPHDAPFGKSCSVSPSALDRESSSFCESDRKFDHADGLLRPEWIQGRKGPNDKEGSRGDYQRNRGGRLQGWIGRI